MRVFVSFDGRDRDRARQIAATLKTEGHEVFFDEHIGARRTWLQEIERALLSVDVFLFVLGDHPPSPSSWARSECDIAIHRAHLDAGLGVMVLCIGTFTIGDLVRHMPFLSRHQVARLGDDGDLGVVVEQLRTARFAGSPLLGSVLATPAPLVGPLDAVATEAFWAQLLSEYDLGSVALDWARRFSRGDPVEASPEVIERVSAVRELRVVRDEVWPLLPPVRVGVRTLTAAGVEVNAAEWGVESGTRLHFEISTSLPVEVVGVACTHPDGAPGPFPDGPDPVVAVPGGISGHVFAELEVGGAPSYEQLVLHCRPAETFLAVRRPTPMPGRPAGESLQAARDYALTEFGPGWLFEALIYHRGGPPAW